MLPFRCTAQLPFRCRQQFSFKLVQPVMNDDAASGQGLLVRNSASQQVMPSDYFCRPRAANEGSSRSEELVSYMPLPNQREKVREAKPHLRPAYLVFSNTARPAAARALEGQRDMLRKIAVVWALRAAIG